MGKSKIYVTSDQINAMNRAKLHMTRILRQSIAKKIHVNQLSLAINLRTSKSVIHNVEKGNIDRLSFNQLFRLMAALEPRFRMLISPDAPCTEEVLEPPDEGPVPKAN